MVLRRWLTGLAASLAATAALMPASISADELAGGTPALKWPDITHETRPRTRWWWLASQPGVSVV